MITGSQVSETITLRLSVVQNNLVLLSRRLVEAETKLNLLRIDEAVAWRNRFPRDEVGADAKVAKLRKLIEERAFLVQFAIETVKRTDAEIASMEKPCGEAALRAQEARRALETAEATLLATSEQHASIIALRNQMLSLADHMRRLEGWQKVTAAAEPALIKSFESDPVFMYLHRKEYGTSEYRAGRMIAAADAWLAKASGYDEAASRYAKVRNYRNLAASWKRQCDGCREELEAEVRREKSRIMNRALERRRQRLADDLNAHDSIRQRIDAARLERDHAVHALLNSFPGNDDEHNSVANQLVSMLAKERASAIMRMVEEGTSNTDDQAKSVIDGIVAERLKLSVEADSTRWQLAAVAKRYSAIGEVLRKLELYMWDTELTVFDLDLHAPVLNELASGAVTPETAWQEIAEAQARAGTVPGGLKSTV